MIVPLMPACRCCHIFAFKISCRHLPRFADAFRPRLPFVRRAPRLRRCLRCAQRKLRHAAASCAPWLLRYAAPARYAELRDAAGLRRFKTLPHMFMRRASHDMIAGGAAADCGICVPEHARCGVTPPPPATASSAERHAAVRLIAAFVPIVFDDAASAAAADAGRFSPCRP